MLKVSKLSKGLVSMAIGLSVFGLSAYADTGPSVADGCAPGTITTGSLAAVACNVIGNLAAVSSFMFAAAYVVGGFFMLFGFFKLKQHKDNAQQVPIGGGIALVAIGAALIFVPAIMSMGGYTLFGTTGQISSPTGILGGPNYNTGQ